MVILGLDSYLELQAVGEDTSLALFISGAFLNKCRYYGLNFAINTFNMNFVLKYLIPKSL